MKILKLNAPRSELSFPQKFAGLFRRMMLSLVIGDKRERNSEHAHDDKKYSESIHFYSPLSKDKPARINTATEIMPEGNLVRNDLFRRIMFFFMFGSRINTKNAKENAYSNDHQHSESVAVHYSPPSRIVPEVRKTIKATDAKTIFRNLNSGENNGVTTAKAKIILAQSCRVLPNLSIGRSLCQGLFAACLLLFASFVFAVNMRTPFVSVSVSGVRPGEEYSLKAAGQRTLKIYNKGTEKITVKFEVLPSAEEGFEAMPDGEWLSFEKDELEIAPGAFAETDVLINVPDEKANYGRKFAAVIVSAGSAGGNISAGLRSKLFFETLKRKSFFGRLFGSVGGAFRPR